MDNSVSVQQWLNECKSKQTKEQYKGRWLIWIEYCKLHDMPTNGDAQLEDMKKRRLSEDQTVKFFYDNHLPRFFTWLRTEYKQTRTTKNIGKPVSEGSALAMSTAIRSFFKYHRYSLDIQKDALPSSEKLQTVFEDHAFDIYQLRSMFNQGDLLERTVLACGVNLWLRASDFIALQRDTIEYLINAEKDLAAKESREPDLLEFEVITQKEQELAVCHLSKETVAMLEEYLKTYAKKNGSLFALSEESLTDLLRRLAEKAKINLKPNTRIRWHCLRKFGITVMHDKIREPVLKLMTGKHIPKDLATYIQQTNETKTAFKAIEPLISLTKSNGNGVSQLAKQLEDLKKTTFKQLALLKMFEKLTTKQEKEKIILELAQEFGITLKGQDVARHDGKRIIEFPSLEEFTDMLTEQIQKKDLERILKENGNGNNHNGIN